MTDPTIPDRAEPGHIELDRARIPAGSAWSTVRAKFSNTSSIAESSSN
jgi:hypothetical protein